LSRVRRGSRSRAKAARRLSREYARITDARRSFLHEVSSQLVKNHARLVIEDLAVHNLLRNGPLARAIGDAAWSEFTRQLAYKAEWFGAELVVCDRWFPSSRTCSRCGKTRERMGLAERVFRCDACELVVDRDRNAAANLAAWAEHARAPDRQAGGRVTNASGGEGLTVDSMTVQPALVKEEPDSGRRWSPGHPRRAASEHHMGVPDALEPMPLP